MTLVVDASVAVKWIIDETGSDSAQTLRLEKSLVAPMLIASELGSALWKAVRRAQFSKADAVPGLNEALAIFADLVPDDELSARALTLAIALDHPIYDCFYLALAERERAPLISADQRLLKAAARLESVETRSL